MPLRESALCRDAPAERSAQPIRVAEHELLSRISAGSYGEVWLARSSMGTYRAVKIVRRAEFADERPYEREFRGIRKFEPVSRLHDGLIDILFVGQDTAAACFYYIMELADDVISGPEIRPANYTARTLAALMVDHQRMPLGDCINLGLRLSDALEFLHQNGLTHRDIKPSNIIFVNHAPKLADVGLVTDLGEARSAVGTDGFIPPEGAGTVKADLYSLGKVLYEISTGRDRNDYPALPPALGNPDQERAFLEFNEVLLKACRTEPSERYASARRMHDDLLLLQGGSSLKQFRATERRLRQVTRFSMGACAFGSLAFTAYLFAHHEMLAGRRVAERETLLRREAEVERRAAHEQSQRAKLEAYKSQHVAQLLKDMLSGIGPEVAKGRDTALMRELLDRTSKRIGTELKDNPEIELEMRTTMGAAYRAVGAFETSEAMYRRALALAIQLRGAESLPTAQILSELANLFTDDQDPAKYLEGEEYARKAVLIRRQLLGPEHLDLSESLIILGDLLHREGRRAEAEATFQEAFRIRQHLFGDDDARTGGALDALAALTEASGKLNEAEVMFRNLVQKRREWLARSPSAEKSLDVAHTLNHLASVCGKAGKLAEAESLLRESWAIRQSLLRAHPDVANSIASLAQLLRQQGRLAEAEALGREELSIRQQVQSEMHPERRTCVNNLASLLREEGKLTEAEKLVHPIGESSAH